LHYRSQLRILMKLTHYCLCLRLAESEYATIWRPSVCLSVCLSRDDEKRMKTGAIAWLLSRGGSSGRGEVTPAWLTLSRTQTAAILPSD